MSIKERVLARKLFSPTVKVAFPRTNPEMIIEIARYSPAERDCAFVRAGRILKEHFGIDDPKLASANEQNMAFIMATGEYLRRHVKGWEPAEGVDAEAVLPFNKENTDLFFQTISNFDLADLVADYADAMAEDQKKIPPAESPIENSSNSSANESSTT